MKKILIANRGEIALRIMRSCKEMGIQTVAIYSDADRSAPFVKYADQSVHIGPSPSSQSYLNGDKIIAICKELSVDGIHPGYGFLSENAAFSDKVKNAGITFIGPSAFSMEMMGSKIEAKKAAKKFGVPLVPGTENALKDVDEAKKIAEKAGYPVLIKASAGGGGKGMRLVQYEGELEEQMQRAMSEAQSAFGDSSVFIEKYVENPKHIEIQILADNHGNCVYLFERDCSVQRRHQKVVEEAPSSILTPEVREKMGTCAVQIAKACQYSGAGTVEFLVDKNLDFYFLEMNTRLQVEHPVTECITGLDLVKEQIKVAQNLPLSFTQADLKIKGHALEIRVYAEDPKNNFLPDIGRLLVYKAPQGLGVRVDDGYEQGMEIPIYYDPMISKLIVYGKDRNECIDKMLRAIDEYQIVGVETTLGFCRFVLQHPEFISGHFDTGFVGKNYQLENLIKSNSQELAIGSVIASKMLALEKASSLKAVSSEKSKWKLNRTAFR